MVSTQSLSDYRKCQPQTNMGHECRMSQYHRVKKQILLLTIKKLKVLES